MVIGNGMIAKAFKQYADDDSIIIFASGVSNSREIRQEEFDREEKLMKSLINKDAILVYFSTCSLYDPTLNSSPYVRHKRVMEYVARYNFNKSIVFRLPNVIGHTENPNTFFNYIKNQIQQQKTISVHRNASRYLIDVDDLTTLLPTIIENYKNSHETGQQNFEVAFDNKTMVMDIVKMMMEIMNKKSEIEIINDGCDYEFDRKSFKEYLKSINYEEPKDYTYNLLKKYLI
jgi:nucleoside-diphosphate-sugar epimerase